MNKKRLTLITATTFATFIGMSNVASASSISSVNHELNQLTTSEQAKIKHGEAHVSELKCGGVVHFVYKEKSGKVVTTTAKIEPMSKLPERMKAQGIRTVNPTHTQIANKSEGRVIKALPQTGDASDMTLGLIGFVMLGGGIYLVYRQKSKTSAMVVALLVGLGGFSTNALATNFGDVHQAIIKQDIVVHEDIEGYDYVGYFLESTGNCQLDQVKVEKDKEKVPESITVDKTIVDKEKLPDTIIKEVPVEKIKEIIKYVPIEVIKEIPVEIIKEVPVEKIVTIIKEVPVEKLVTIIKEVPVEKIVTVIKEVPVEKLVTVIKEVPVEKIVTVIKEVPVEKIVTVIKEVPVEKIVTVFKEVPVEKIVEVIKEVPVEKIVKVVKEVKVETIKESIAYETEFITDKSLDLGLTEVRTQGVNGEKINGKVTKESVKQVIAIGGKVIEIVPFTYKEVEDPELPMGETIIVHGKNGEKVNGEVTKQPVDGVIRKGTKQPPSTSTVESMSYATEIIYDDTLNAGVHQVRTEGQAGERIRETGEVTKAPITKVVVVGTKLVETIPYTYDKIEDPTLPVGETVITHGENGEKVNGEITKAPINGVIKKGTMPIEPVMIKFPDGRVIEYFGNVANLSNDEIFNKLNEPSNDLIPNEITNQDGKIYHNPTTVTKVSDVEYHVNYDVKHITEIVPFDTEIIYDSNMLSGTEEVRAQGVVGERVDGVITTQPVNKVVAVGTKCPPKPTEPEQPTDPIEETEPPTTVLSTPITVKLPNGETIKIDVTDPNDLTSIANHPSIPAEVEKQGTDDRGQRYIDTYYGDKKITKLEDGSYVVDYAKIDHTVEIEDGEE